MTDSHGTAVATGDRSRCPRPAAANTASALVCVLANPPTTSGARTLGRVGQAAEILGYRDAEVVNLFPLATYRTGGINDLGAEAAHWHHARGPIEGALNRAAAVLIGYGATEPSGLARGHHRDQVAWLRQQIVERKLPTYQVGDGPRHPSRWQRWTFRHHPEVPFSEALRLSLRLVSYDRTDNQQAASRPQGHVPGHHRR
jgi:hypothetical protein